MSTPALIAVKTGNTYKVAYLHWDGYIDHAGRILNQFYNSEEKAQALVALGDMSEIGESTEATVYYHRDRGDNWNRTAPRTAGSKRNIRLSGGSQKYIYVFEDGLWFVQGKSGLVKLSALI